MRITSSLQLPQTSSPPGRGGDAAPATHYGAESERVVVLDYWRILRKRLWLVIMVFLSAVLTTAVIVFMMPPTYMAEATLLIQPRVPQVLAIREALAQPLGPDEYDYYKTQYEMLKRYTLAARVIREQRLEANSNFTGENHASFFTELWTNVKAFLVQYFSSPPHVNPAELPLGVRPEFLEAYRKKLEIRPLQGTRLVKVAFALSDPALSAQVANAHAETYIRQGIESHVQASEEARRFLESKLVELKARVERSEAALNRYRRGRKLISPDDKENIVLGRLSELNRLLTGAEAEKIALEAQVRLVRQGAYERFPAFAENHLIQSLKEQVTRLKNEYASLSVLYMPGYPKLEQVRVQLEETQQRLRQEVEQLVRGVNMAYRAAEAKEKSLLARMEEQKEAALKLKDDAVEYAILAREADTNRQLYDSVLQSMKEMSIQTELRDTNISFVDRAIPPFAPTKPKKALGLLVSAVVGLVGGIGVAFFCESLDRTLKTSEDVARYTQLPSLGIVPDFSQLQFQRNTPQALPPLPSSIAHENGRELVLAHPPLSIITEAYRTLRTVILLSRAEEPPHTILFTSGTYGEGKTVTVLNTAIVFAQMGARVLVIDADLHQARCHKILQTSNRLGLTEFLTGNAELIRVIRPTTTKRLAFLCSGATPPNPADLLGSKRMRFALSTLRSHYDYVLIDSPPVVPVSDAVILSTLVDGVVMVVNSQKTPNNIVKEACARLRYARSRVLGIVLNNANLQDGDYADCYHRYYV